MPAPDGWFLRLPLRQSQALSIRRRLLAGYGRRRRDLPWRRSRDPYRILVSEVMLQQTTVAAVLPYYERFIKQFPDLATLDYPVAIPDIHSNDHSNDLRTTRKRYQPYHTDHSRWVENYPQEKYPPIYPCRLCQNSWHDRE